MNQSQRVLVAGTGISGIAAAKLVLERGGDVVLYDGNAALKEEDIKEKFDRDAKVTVVLGKSSVPTCWAWSCALSVPVYLLTVLLWPLWTMSRFLF